MVEHNSQVSHTLHGWNAVITNLDDIDWHVHFNIGSRECYHFRLVVIKFQMIACHPHVNVLDTPLRSMNLNGWIVIDVKRNIKLNISCIEVPIEVMAAYDVSEG